MASEPGGDRAVEHVDAERDPLDQVVGLPDPEQVTRGHRVEPAEGHRDHAAHLVLVASQRPADRQPVHGRRRDPLGGRATEVLMDAALHDPEHGLASRALALVPRQAPIEPAVCPLGRSRGVFAIGVVGGALVEGQGDVGAERSLDRHRSLRAEELLRSIEVGAKPHPLLADLENRSPAGPAPAAPLDLIGHGPVSEREDLKAAGVGDDRPPPPHEPMEPAERGDPIRPGRQHEVEGVPEHHLVAEPGDLGRAQGADAPAGRQRNERRRLDDPRSRVEPPGAGGSIARRDLEPKPLRVAAHDPNSRLGLTSRSPARRGSGRRSRSGAACVPRAWGCGPRARRGRNRR